MKKFIALLCMVCMLFTFVACAAPEAPVVDEPVDSQEPVVDPSDEPAPTEPAEPTYDYEFVRIGTASVGGQFYNFGSAVASLVNDKMGLTATAEATSGSAANCDLIANGDVELAFCFGNTLNEAVLGIGAFDGQAPYDSLRAVAVVGFNLFHIMVRTDANITSLEDFAGKKVGLGPLGGGNESGTRKILAAVGVTEFNPVYGTMTEMHEGLKNGSIDCAILSTQVGASAFADTISDDKVQLLALEPDFAEQYASGDASLSVMTIPGGEYQDENEDVLTVGFSAFLFCDASLNEDFVYDFAKVFYENNDYLVASYATLSNAVPENALSGLCLPLHPGVERYLQEIGIK